MEFPHLALIRPKRWPVPCKRQPEFELQEAGGS